MKSMKKPKIRSVKFNVAMNMILTSSSFIFPLITVPYASRTLGTYGTGAVAFAQSTTNYFALFALLGMSSYGVRECARVRDDNVKLSKLVQELLVKNTRLGAYLKPQRPPLHGRARGHRRDTVYPI
jgi:hypothetical protein